MMINKYMYILWVTFCSYFSFLFAQENSACLGRSSNSGLCWGCSFFYFRESGVRGNISEEICKARINASITLDIYVVNTTCATDLPCDGSEATPFDSLGKALSFSHKNANQYTGSEIRINLLGDFHYLLRNSFEEEGQELFRSMNTSLTIGPWLCSSKPLKGCFAADTNAKIMIKTDMIFIFVSGTLKLTRIDFLGNDLHLLNSTDIKSSNDCANLKRICCDRTSLLGGDFLLNPCGVKNRGMKFDNTDLWKNRFGLFNLEPIPDIPNKEKSPPGLLIESTSFSDFYPAKQNSGWTSIITAGHSGGLKIELKKFCFRTLGF